jgi:hypothetical protein
LPDRFGADQPVFFSTPGRLLRISPCFDIFLPSATKVDFFIITKVKEAGQSCCGGGIGRPQMKSVDEIRKNYRFSVADEEVLPRPVIHT